MFEHDPKLKILEVAPSGVVEIHHSLNTAEVATQEFVGETARAYICIISLASGRRALFVSFFYPNKNRAIFYPYSNNPFPAERMEEVKEEAMLFLESFGLIMEEVVGEKTTLKDKEHWMTRVPFFKTGVPAGEIILRTSSLTFPADGASQLVISSDVIRDSKGEMVANGTKIKVGTNLGILITLDGTGYNQQMVVSTMEGMVSFLLQAPGKIGKAVVTAASEEGSAVGEITVDFHPLDPSGEIKLEAIPLKPPADGKTRVNIQSKPIADSLGNLVADDTPFTVEISCQEKVHSSLPITSKNGIIMHSMVAPATPMTMLVSVKSQKGQAKGELVITFEALLPLIEEKPAPPASRPSKLPSPPAKTQVESLALEEEAASPSSGKISPSALAASETGSAFLDETTEESVFQEEEAAVAMEEEAKKLTKIPAALPPASIKKEAEKKLSPLLSIGTAAEAISPEKTPEPAVKTGNRQSGENSAPTPAVSPAWEPYQDLIKFLTHM